MKTMFASNVPKIIAKLVMLMSLSARPVKIPLNFKPKHKEKPNAKVLATKGIETIMVFVINAKLMAARLARTLLIPVTFALLIRCFKETSA